MELHITHITSLEAARLLLTPATQPEKYNAGSSFNLPLLLRNTGKRSVAWSDAHPLHLSYRWINEAGEMVERDGMRTSIATPPGPGNEVAVAMSGRTPNEPGNYRLLSSLVLEGVHWACDVDEHGWTELNVRVQATPAWPSELRNSTGGKALRGALTRAGLARSLDGRISSLSTETPGHAVVDPSTAGPGPLPVSNGNILRNWVRRTLGIRNVQQDLERIANAVTRQEQRSTDLHNYLERIEMQLREDSSELRGEIAQIAASLRKEQIFTKLNALEVNRILATVRDELKIQSGQSQRFPADERSHRNLDTLEEEGRDAK